MAILEEEIKRRKAAAALLDSEESDEEETDSEQPDSESESEPADSESSDESDSKEPTPSEVYVPPTKRAPSFVLVPAPQVEKPKPKEAPTPSPYLSWEGADIPPESRAVPEAGKTFTPGSYDTSVDLTGENEKRYTTDPETGTRYAIDTDTGAKIPRAELATEADKAAQPPDATLLPQVEVTGDVPVRRAELVDPDPDRQYFDRAQAGGQPAPDTLSQVEKAQAVRGPAPDKLPQVERGELVSVPPGTAPRAIGRAAPVSTPPAIKRGELVDPDADTQYVDSSGNYIQPPPATPPEAKPAEQPVAVPAQKPRASEFGLTPDEYKAAAQAPARATTPSTTPSTTADSGVNRVQQGGTNLKGTDSRLTEIVTAAASVLPPGYTIQPTSGVRTAGQGQHTLGKAQDWQIFKPDGTPVVNRGDDSTGLYTQLARAAYGYQEKYHPELTGQFQWGGQFGTSTANNPNEPDLMHFDIGGRRGRIERYSRESIGAVLPPVAGGAAAPTPGDQNYITGHATTFGYNDPQDSGVGAPKLGGLSTNNTDLIGIAVPQGALQSYVSAHPADWRKARVDVVTGNGRHVLVPIVDLGPRDTSGAVVADFTQGLTNLVGNTGEQNYQFRIIPNAGPDVMKNPQEFADEQAAIREGINTGARFRPKPPAKASYVLAPQNPAISVAAEQAQTFDNQGQKDNLSTLADQTPNLGALIKRLDQPVDGVTNAMRKEYQDQVKAEATKYAQDYYHEPDPQKAYALITSDASAGTFAGEVLSKIIPNFGKADVSIAKFMDSADEKRVKQFVDTLEPNATIDARAQEVQRLKDTVPEMRGPVINAMLGAAEPTAAQAVGDPGNILDSLNRITDPKYQTARTAAITEKQNWVNNSLRTDPRLVGTPAEFITQQLAALPKNIVESLLPPGARETAFYAEIYEDAKEQFRRSNPQMSEEELDQKANLSATAQLIPQEVLMHAIGGKFGALAARIENPVQRIAASALTHTAIGATAGAVQQVGSNIVAGQGPLAGVLESAAGGAIQSFPGGVVAGFHGGPAHVAAEPARTEAAPLGQEPVTPPPTTGLAGGALRGAKPETLEIGGEPEAPPRADVVPRGTIESEPAPARPEADIEAELNRQSDALYQRLEADINLPRAKPGDIQGGATEPGVQGAGAIPEREPGVLPSAEGTSSADVEGQRAAASRPGTTGAYASDPVFNRAVGVQTNGNIAATRHLFDSLGVSITPKTASDRAFRTGFDSNGRISLEYNPDLVARDAATIQAQGGDFKSHIRASVQEELIHAAHLAELRDSWRKTDPAQPFDSFANKYHSDLLDQTQRVIADAQRRGNKALAQDLRQALRESIDVYDPQIGSKFPDSADQTLTKVKTDPILASSVANELVRQLVQIRSGNPVTEHSWQGLLGTAKQWITRTLVGLKRLAGKVETGYAGRMLRDAVVSTEGRLRDIARLERGENPPPASSGQQFARRAKVGAGGPGPLTRLGSGLSSRARWLSSIVKGGESFLLDRPETRPLALAERRRPSFEQQFGARARVQELADTFNSVPGRDRARVVKEFSDYIRAEQNRQPLPAIGADTRRIIQAGKNSLEQLGQIAKELNVHVRTSDGKIRPMKMIGRDYYPRMISADTQEIFNHRDDTRAADFNALVNREIAAGKVKSRDEFIDKFTHAVTPDATSNSHFGNIEKAREADLPLDFYDFSPEALLKYATRSTDRLSQIAAFGQKLSSKGKDLFDSTIEQVQRASGLSHADKQIIINRIGQERKAEYQEREKTNLGKLSSLARTGASGAFLGNPITSAYNLIGGAGQNLVFGGPGTFLKTAAKFATIKGALENIKEARERNILKTNLRDILTDYDLVTNQGWATKGVQGFTKHMLNWGGQNLTEGINRAFAMQQAKYILNRFARVYGQDNVSARSLYAMIQRRGVHDLAGLAREKGQGPLTDEFLRQYTMDVHGNYGPSQSAAHLFDSPAGKVLLQFQKWSANTQRMATREFIMPLVKAAKDRQPADFAYHLMRNLGYIAAAVGTGGAQQLVSNFLRDKDPRKPSIGEIYTRFAHGENWKALQYALQRAQDMVILSGFAGTLGNYSDLANQLTGSDPGGRVKDPLHPPIVSLFQPFQELIQGWHGEGGSSPSPRILDQFAQQISSAYRVGKQTLLTGANAVGLRFKPGEEMAAQNDLSFLRNRVKMFEADNPELQAKQELKGNQSMSFAGRSEFDPYKDRIQAALLTGHPEEMNLAIAEWLGRFPPAEQPGAPQSD